MTEARISPDYSSEGLGEQLFDLERARLKERRLRLEAEGVLEGLRVLNTATTTLQVFNHLVAIFQRFIPFQDAILLAAPGPGDWQTVYATAAEYKNLCWPPSAALQRVLDGQVVAVFDVAAVPTWSAQPEAVRARVGSALHVPINTGTRTAILVFTHPARAAFDRRHCRLLERFAPLTNQALASIEYRERLDAEQRNVASAHDVVRREVAERRLAEQRLLKLNRLYEALGATGAALVRASRVEELYQELCRICVELGGLASACVLARGAEENAIEVLARHPARAPAPEPAADAGLVQSVLGTGKPEIYNDYTPPGGARPGGAGLSIAAFPLRDQGSVVAVLGLRADQRGFFDADIARLIERITSDVTLALGNLLQQRLRQQAENSLRRSEENLRVAAAAFEAQIAMVVLDADQRILRVNRAFQQETGYRPEDLIGLKPTVLASGCHPTHFYETMWREVHACGAWQGEVFARRKDGSIYPKWLSITAVRNDEGTITHYVSSQMDISASKAAEEAIRNMAFYDSLTGLPNRRLLTDRLHQAMAMSARVGSTCALLFIDLDHFKTLNDTLGHDKGDRLLQLVAERLKACIRESDTVGRLGGDEFVLMQEDLAANPSKAADQARLLGERVLACINQPFMLDGLEHYTTASIGVALFQGHDAQLGDLMKHADLAMYQAKAGGRNALRFFSPEMQAVVTARVAMEKELRQALRRQEFVLYYQPQVDADGRMSGAESLVRWQHPQRGFVSPAEFIPLAEETGHIVALGQWVLETACEQLAAWGRDPRAAHLEMAVNISAKQFYHPDFVGQVLATVDRTGANPHRLKLELTESMLLTGFDDIVDKMAALKAHGISFSLDDFGTGYSSLSYLKRLPLDQLKIDQSFVRDILEDPNDAAIAKTIVALGHTLSLSVIAEGVETEEQLTFLAVNGCNAYQGYLFSRPLPAAELQQFVLMNS